MTTTAPAAAAQHDTDALLDRVIQLQTQAKLIEAELQAAKDQLSAALDAGDLDPSFSHNDWAFAYQQGRLSTTYSPQAKEAIKKIQQSDIEMGHAVQSRGSGFWTIKAPTL